MTSPTGPSRTAALWLPSVAQMMVLLDATIVNIALPDIRRGLHFSGPGLAWVVAGYAVVFGGLLLLGGRLGDRWGHRRVFVAGLLVFTVASLMGGLATGPGWLIGARVLQAAGAAAVSPTALSLLTTSFTGAAERARAVGIYTALATSGGGVGLVLGGVITSTLSWRWVMFVNVPIGVLLVVGTLLLLPVPESGRGRLDVPGAVTGTTTATLFVAVLILAAPDEVGSTRVPLPLLLVGAVSAVVLGGCFLTLERRHPSPLVPLGLFADRSRACAFLVLATTAAAMVGTFFYMTLQLQTVWQWSPLRTAGVFLPSTLVLVAGARLGPPLLTRLGVRAVVAVGLAASAVGMLWLSRLDDASSWVLGVLVPSLLAYAGLGVVAVPLTLCAVGGATSRDAGAVSGVVNALRQVGGAAGLAVTGAVVWHVAGPSPGPAALQSGVRAGLLLDGGILVVSLGVALALLPAAPPRAERPVVDPPRRRPGANVR